MTKVTGYCKIAFAERIQKSVTWRKKDMFIIAGLGNPDRQYEGTRHNVGFDVIDRLADKYNIDVYAKKHWALIGKGVI